MRGSSSNGIIEKKENGSINLWVRFEWTRNYYWLYGVDPNGPVKDIVKERIYIMKGIPTNNQELYYKGGKELLTNDAKLGDFDKITMKLIGVDFVHVDVKCDMCRCKSIVGTRHKATNRTNYNLCQECYERYDSNTADGGGYSSSLSNPRSYNGEVGDIQFEKIMGRTLNIRVETADASQTKRHFNIKDVDSLGLVKDIVNARIDERDGIPANNQDLYFRGRRLQNTDRLESNDTIELKLVGMDFIDDTITCNQCGSSSIAGKGYRVTKNKEIYHLCQICYETTTNTKDCFHVRPFLGRLKLHAVDNSTISKCGCAPHDPRCNFLFVLDNTKDVKPASLVDTHNNKISSLKEVTKSNLKTILRDMEEGAFCLTSFNRFREQVKARYTIYGSRHNIWNLDLFSGNDFLTQEEAFYNNLSRSINSKLRRLCNDTLEGDEQIDGIEGLSTLVRSYLKGESNTNNLIDRDLKMKLLIIIIKDFDLDFINPRRFGHLKEYYIRCGVLNFLGKRRSQRHISLIPVSLLKHMSNFERYNDGNVMTKIPLELLECLVDLTDSYHLRLKILKSIGYSLYFISHRWLRKDDPDPNHVQFKLAKSFFNVKNDPDVYLFYDYQCLPQGESIKGLYMALDFVLINSTVAIIPTDDFMDRTWCFFETMLLGGFGGHNILGDDHNLATSIQSRIDGLFSYGIQDKLQKYIDETTCTCGKDKQIIKVLFHMMAKYIMLET